MATFRVTIRRDTTVPPLWDWMQTVIARDAATALGYAYASWEQDEGLVPALSQCQYSVRQVNIGLALSASTTSPAQQQFIQSLQDQVSAYLASRLDGAFSMVNYPSGFNYGITYGSNGYWNAATLQDIDTLLSQGSNGMLELTGQRFSTMYAQLLQAVTFSFSQADQTTMNAQDAAASAQIASILTEFQNAGGTYTNPLPFGGKLQDVFNQLTHQFGSLNNLPDTMSALRNAVANYKSAAGNSYALHNRYYAATAEVAAAIANTTRPSAINGGMQTDTSSYYVGYTPNKLPSANQLIGSLATDGSAVTVKVSLSSFQSSTAKLSVSGSVGLDIPIASIIGFKLNASTSYDMTDFVSSSSSVTMELVYKGVTLFSAMPTPLSTDNSTGWYANDIIKEVAANAKEDVTGLKLQGSEFDVSELFGPGCAFSRLKTFVISQFPTITLNFQAADSHKITSAFAVNASMEVDLLGLFNLGSASASYSVAKVDSNSSDGSVTVTFRPPTVSGTIPLQQQVAYVMGGVASYPPKHI